MQDYQEEPSSHNLDYLLNGPYGRSYQERQRLAQPGQTFFGDVLIDEDGMTGVGGDFQLNYGSADDVTPFAQPGRAGREKQMQRLAQRQPDRGDEDDWFSNQRGDRGRQQQQQQQPGRSGREKQMQRLAQQQPHRSDEDDWFNNQRGDHGRLQQRQQQQQPSRNIRVNYQSSGPVLDAQYYAAPPPPPPPPYAPVPLPLPHAPVVRPPLYFEKAHAGPRSGPSRGYPSSNEISAGYQHAPLASPPQPSAPKIELSIRGAAQRRQEQNQNQNQRGTGGGDRSGEGREWDRGKERSYRDRDGHPERGQRTGYHENHRRY